MRINARELPHHLARTLPPVCLLHGEEALLIEESRDALLRAAGERGFDERISLSVEPNFDWGRLSSNAAALSLFSNRRLMDLRMPTGRPGDAGAKAISEFCARPSEDTALLITCGRIDARSRQAKWLKAADAAGVVVEHPAITTKELPNWISSRLTRHQLRAEPDALRWLAHFLEGNLLAAAQEIEKLALLCAPGSLIDVNTVTSAVVDHARFSIYGLADACLAGRLEKMLRMLAGLRREGVDPVLISWALGREIRALAGIAAGLRGGRNKGTLFKAYNIWSRRTPLVETALRRLDDDELVGAVRQLAQLDRILKGRAPGDVWLALELLCLRLCGVRTLAAQADAVAG